MKTQGSDSLMSTATRPTRRVTIVAQDPSVRDLGGTILTADVEVPVEALAPGPMGSRIHVIDYDSSTSTLYQPARFPERSKRTLPDLLMHKGNRAILGSPAFHAQNVYAIAMRTLSRFEHALGRRVSWSFRGHQLKIAPHAFADANAFYSERDEALLFGYFPARHGGSVFSCLSHDVVAHETSHALLDGLRDHFTDPSSPDQAAFHEGFSDVVALLSVFSIREVVKAMMDRRQGRMPKRSRDANLINVAETAEPALRKSLLLALAKQMGTELSQNRVAALRRSTTLPESAKLLEQDEFLEPHRRGEVLVAAMLRAFVAVWARRLKGLRRVRRQYLDRERVAEEAADAADYLLTMTIRALDYTPPVHLTFGDFLSALLTADREIRPDDSRYRFRDHLRESFRSYGIEPAAKGGEEPGLWDPAPAGLSYEGMHFEAMKREPDEVFRFIWENRGRLRLYEGAYTRVNSVRPCLRIGPDGFALRETVVECIQQLEVSASELRRLSVERPMGMPGNTRVVLSGGLTLIFDDYGRVKYSISNRVHDSRDSKTQVRQSQRLEYLWRFGHFKKGASLTRRLSTLHRMRALGAPRKITEQW